MWPVSLSAFLLAYAVFGGRYDCSQVKVQEEQQGGGAKPPSEGGAGLYLGELRMMMRRLLQDEDIYNTVRCSQFVQSGNWIFSSPDHQSLA